MYSEPEPPLCQIPIQRIEVKFWPSVLFDEKKKKILVLGSHLKLLEFHFFDIQQTKHNGWHLKMSFKAIFLQRLVPSLWNRGSFPQQNAFLGHFACHDVEFPHSPPSQILYIIVQRGTNTQKSKAAMHRDDLNFWWPSGNRE